MGGMRPLVAVVAGACAVSLAATAAVFAPARPSLGPAATTADATTGAPPVPRLVA